MQHPPSVSNGPTVHECGPQMSLSACLLHFACDLLECRVSELFVAGASSISGDQGFLLKGRVKIYRPGRHSHISRWGRGRRVRTHTPIHTHTTRTCISAHTHTRRQRKEGGRLWWSGRLRGQSEVGPRVVWRGDRDRLSVVCVCVCLAVTQTPWGVADSHQLPVNNVRRRRKVKTRRKQLRVCAVASQPITARRILRSKFSKNAGGVVPRATFPQHDSACCELNSPDMMRKSSQFRENVWDTKKKKTQYMNCL